MVAQVGAHVQLIYLAELLQLLVYLYACVCVCVCVCVCCVCVLCVCVYELFNLDTYTSSSILPNLYLDAYVFVR
jgi:hypothetical protein